MTRQMLQHAATADPVQYLTPLRCLLSQAFENKGRHSFVFSVWNRLSGLRSPALPSVGNIGRHSVALSLWNRLSGLGRGDAIHYHHGGCSVSISCHHESATMLQVRQGYVHVWGDSSPRSHIDAAAKPPMLVPELDPDAESAVLRDGSEPLHAGKRYLRGTTIIIRLTIDGSVPSVRWFCICERLPLVVFRCVVGAALLVCLGHYSLVQVMSQEASYINRDSQRALWRLDCLSMCMAMDR